jgi:hypothetical protein
MNPAPVFAFVFGLTAIVHASDNSDEIFYEEVPEHQPHFEYRRGPTIKDSDADGGQWYYKFKTGSDKRLGPARDVAAVKALLPSTMPVTIRWISRSVVVVAADCYSDAHFSRRVRCLYVLEKHGSKWKVTHHYSHGLPTIVRSNQALQPTAGRLENYKVEIRE